MKAAFELQSACVFERDSKGNQGFLIFSVCIIGQYILCSMYIIVAFLKVSDRKKVDLNA